MLEARPNPPAETFVRRVAWEPRKVTASVVIGGEEHRIWIAASEDLFRETDFLLPVALLPAMKAGAPLTLPGKVSTRLLSSTPQIQDVFGMWETVYRHITVQAGTRDDVAHRASGVACVFGGGIDSFHTLLRHSEEISHMIHLHVPSRDLSAAETRARRVRDVAGELGKALIEVETNLHELARGTRIDWKYFHGPWIASAALLFQHVFHRVMIAGSTTSNYDNLRPQGTHPILDPLWSTELTDFHHDGCEVRRVEKAAYIAEHEVAMNHLQVCDLTRGAYNCGRCEKCLRSMLNLKAAGALERCKTLPDEIPLEALANLDLSGYSASYFARENLRALQQLGTEPDLVKNLNEALEEGATRIAHSGYAEEALDQALARIGSLHERADRLAARGKRLKATNEKLRERNSKLTDDLSRRRYRIADAVAETLQRLSFLRPFKGRKRPVDKTDVDN